MACSQSINDDHWIYSVDLVYNGSSLWPVVECLKGPQHENWQFIFYTIDHLQIKSAQNAAVQHEQHGITWKLMWNFSTEMEMEMEHWTCSFNLFIYRNIWMTQAILVIP